MKHYYATGIVALISLCQLQASEEKQLQVPEKTEISRLVTGKMYIDGPIAYGPKEYYENFNNQEICSAGSAPFFQNRHICASSYEPLIQVSVTINDIDESNNSVKRPWTKNDSNYVLDGRGREIENEKQITSIPSVIERLEREQYEDYHGTEVIPANIAWEIKERYFPSYLPLKMFRECKLADAQMKFLIRSFTVLLQCVDNPHEQGTSFQDDLQKRLQSYIETPRYFKWHHEGYGAWTTYQPIAKLMEQGLIAHKKLPANTTKLMRMCHKSTILCSKYCSMDPNKYEHGAKGQETVERIKEMFSHLLVTTPEDPEDALAIQAFPTF